MENEYRGGLLVTQATCDIIKRADLDSHVTAEGGAGARQFTGLLKPVHVVGRRGSSRVAHLHQGLVHAGHVHRARARALHAAHRHAQGNFWCKHALHRFKQCVATSLKAQA